ncbi:vesicle-associated membrane protein 7 [Fistulifera solaris]|uniref:Vesicle-associated membrane protein 7 n=1 Tax=Fistulifera solaris TaxID=1519565 RepID=A0A1Z5JA20_FISSO|nr:vesicle-associated membrane protein 7 [Fistulifera solaris]|eukprot:GAX10844.1 vesicle-associated membrane protein 7 [Fistulifera solaris]
MTIVYALVSVGGKNVLAEYTATSGNFPTVTRVLLAKIPAHDGQMTYQYDNYNFHYIVEGGVCFLCMSDQANKHRIPYAFLNDMKARFWAQFGNEEPLQAIAFSYNESFAPILEERMNFYNSEEADQTIDNIGAVKSQIEDVKQVMVQNIEKVLERGEKIELLVDKTDRLNQQAFRFESSSRNLRRAMYWRKMRCYAYMGVAALVLLLVGSASLCGGVDFRHCRAHH